MSKQKWLSDYMEIARECCSALAISLSMVALAGCTGLTVTPPPVPASTVSITPASVNFGSQPLNTPSAAQTLTLSNTGKGTLAINSVSVSGANNADFSQTNTCAISPATLAAGGSCTINDTVKPSVNGSESAAISVTDDASGSPQTLLLSGNGSSGGGPPPPAQLPVGLTI